MVLGRARGGDRLAARRDPPRAGLAPDAAWSCAAMGIAAVARSPAGRGRRGWGTGRALAVGLASGLGLYVATRLFVAVAGRWEPFRRGVVEKYQEAAEVSLRRGAGPVVADHGAGRGAVLARVVPGAARPVARRLRPRASGPGSAYVGVNLREREPADRRRRRGRGGPLGRPRGVVGRDAREPRQPYALDGSDAGAPAGSRARRAHGVSFLSTAVQQVLDQGSFCAVASSTPRGPHCTPLVFAYSGGRVWLTTSREVREGAGVEARPRRGRAGPLRRVVGVVHRHRPRLRRPRPEHVGCGGGERDRRSPARAPGSAGRTRSSSPGTRSTRDRCRSRGRHRDASSWAIDLDRTALLGEDGVQEGRGRWGGEATSHATFRSTKGTDDPSRRAARGRAQRTWGPDGDAALTLGGDRGPVVVPVRWRRRGRVALRRAAGRDAGARGRRSRRAGRAHDRPGVGVAGARHGRRHGPGHRLRSTCWTSSAPVRRPRVRSRPRSTRRPARSSGSRRRDWSGGRDGPAGASPSRDDRRVLGRGRRVAGARLGGHEQPGQPSPLGQAHRVRRLSPKAASPTAFATG